MQPTTLQLIFAQPPVSPCYCISADCFAKKRHLAAGGSAVRRRCGARAGHAGRQQADAAAVGACQAGAAQLWQESAKTDLMTEVLVRYNLCATRGSIITSSTQILRFAIGDMSWSSYGATST